eukprot:9680686-Alexandrium_andersonii.AAC.1
MSSERSKELSNSRNNESMSKDDADKLLDQAWAGGADVEMKAKDGWMGDPPNPPSSDEVGPEKASQEGHRARDLGEGVHHEARED